MVQFFMITNKNLKSVRLGHFSIFFYKSLDSNSPMRPDLGFNRFETLLDTGRSLRSSINKRWAAFQ